MCRWNIWPSWQDGRITPTKRRFGEAAWHLSVPFGDFGLDAGCSVQRRQGLKALTKTATDLAAVEQICKYVKGAGALSGAEKPVEWTCPYGWYLAWSSANAFLLVGQHVVAACLLGCL